MAATHRCSEMLLIVFLGMPGVLVGVPIDRDTSGLTVELRGGAAVRHGKGAERGVGPQRHKYKVVIAIGGDRVRGPCGMTSPCWHIICGQLLQDLLVLRVDHAERGRTFRRGGGERAERT